MFVGMEIANLKSVLIHPHRLEERLSYLEEHL